MKTSAEKYAKQISLRSKKATLTAMARELTETNATRLLYYLIGWANIGDSFWDGMTQGLAYVLNQQAIDTTIKEAK